MYGSCVTYFCINDFLFIVNFQGLTILAFNNGKLNAKTLREVLSLGPTFVVMKFFESMYLLYIFRHIFSCHPLVIFSHFHFFLRCSGHFHDVWCIFNNKTLSCLSNFFTFSLVQPCFSFHNFPLCVCMPSVIIILFLCSLILILLSICFDFFYSCEVILHFQMFVHDCRKALQEESKSNGNSVVFRLYVIVIGIYAGVQFFISFLMRIPACHRLTNQCGRWPLVHFVKWLRQVYISSVALVVANYISSFNLVCSIYCGIMLTDGFGFIVFSVD